MLEAIDATPGCGRSSSSRTARTARWSCDWSTTLALGELAARCATWATKSAPRFCWATRRGARRSGQYGQARGRAGPTCLVTAWRRSGCWSPGPRGDLHENRRGIFLLASRGGVARSACPPCPDHSALDAHRPRHVVARSLTRRRATGCRASSPASRPGGCSCLSSSGGALIAVLEQAGGWWWWDTAWWSRRPPTWAAWASPRGRRGGGGWGRSRPRLDAHLSNAARRRDEWSGDEGRSAVPLVSGEPVEVEAAAAGRRVRCGARAGLPLCA